MASSFTYTTLVDAIKALAEDFGTEFAAFIPTIIQLAEDKILRDLDLEYFDVVTATNFVAASPLVTKPTGTIATRSLHYTDASGNFVHVDPRSWEFVKDYWPNETTTTAAPKYFTEYSATQWYFAGTPSGTNAVTSRCVIVPTGLSGSNPTTWLSQYMGDLLLMACMACSEQFLKADERIPVWKQEYAERISGASRILKTADRADYSPVTATPVKEM